MVRPDLNTWGHSLADLRRLAVNAQHPRSRERLLALYMIASQQTNATTWAAHIGHTKETVLSWVHRYNLAGLAGVIYRHTGGRHPLLGQEQLDQLVHTVVETDPLDHGLPGHAWTLKKLRRWLEQVIGYACSRTTLHRVLRAQRLSWKKCQKVLKKADPQRRAAFVQQFQELFARLCPPGYPLALYR